MADLFGEIERRVTVARAYAQWKNRRPWCWLTTSVRPHVFRRWFVEEEVGSLHG